MTPLRPDHGQEESHSPAAGGTPRHLPSRRAFLKMILAGIPLLTAQDIVSPNIIGGCPTFEELPDDCELIGQMVGVRLEGITERIRTCILRCGDALELRIGEDAYQFLNKLEKNDRPISEMIASIRFRKRQDLLAFSSRCMPGSVNIARADY